jgi:serine/threonine protein kinase
VSDSLFDEYPRTLKEDEPLYIDKWKILYVIGAGGMGKVFEGISKDATKAAIKIIQPQFIDDQFLARFRKEIDAMKMINSPYVAKVIDSNIDHDPPFMAIELIHGKTLAKIINNKTEISENHWRLIAKQLLMGLQEVDARKLVHRDIKPANIMQLTDRAEIRIIDFGVVKGADRSNRSNQTVLAGTMSYMSPEQLNFEVPTHKSDIFSAGITLAQLVTGKHPFASIDSNEPIEQRIKEFEPNLIGLSDLQRNVCKALLQKDPSLRPNASQVIEEFKLRIPLLPRKFMKKSIPVKTPPIKKDVDKKREVGNIHDPVLEGLVGEIETNKLIPEILVKPKKKYITPHYRKERQKLADVLKIFLTKHSEKVFKIRFFSRVFNTEIYFQGYTDENSNLLAEAMSDKFLSMKFNLTDLKKMSELGFRSPTNENPNYFITLPKNESNISLIAKMIADALFDIYEGSHFSEIFLNQMTSETTKEILVKTGVTVAGDGSFKIGSLQKLKSATDQYQKWQVIGLVERNSPYGYVLKKVMARHIENNRIHERTNNSAWLFKGVDSNPFSTVAAESSMLKGLVFNKKVITLFDQSNKEDRELNFEHIRSFIDFVPTLSDKYLEEEKANPLTNEMIKLAEISKKDHDFSDYLSMEFEEGLSLFTLTSSEFDNDLVLGLFAKHPITNKFYGRKNGEWKLLFESPLRYGFSVSFVTKEFIDLFDRRSKLPNKPIRWEEMERLGFLYE